MPTCRRKRVILTETPAALFPAVGGDPNKEIYYMEQTGEIFETYEAYAARMSFYRLKQFQCEVTGKSGLDYFQAVESERQEARTLHSRFSEPLKTPILKAVQWQVMGRLDNLVEAVFERFKDRYFKGEKILVELCGIKYFARVEKVYPPKYSYDPAVRDAHKDQTNDDGEFPEEETPHVIGGDLNIPTKDATHKDDPAMYYYWVHVMEPEKGERGKSSKASAEENFVGSLMEVQCGMMSRDRLSFSKSILRRFIRDCVDRDAAVASPWTVKPGIAVRYGVDSIMPEETRKGVETIKKGEIDKRKKVWEDKEGPPTKRQKKMTAAQEERAIAAEKKERDAREKAEKQRLEAERLAAEKKKKKPVRYPTEDLDVRLNDKDKKGGMKVKRPVPSRVAVPFNEYPGAFESFLMAWNFLISYGQPLHLSTFTLDEFEHAIRHSVLDPPCILLAEVHATLIYNLRTVPFHRHSALLSLLRYKDEIEENEPLVDIESDLVHGVSIETLTGAMADVGNNWERVPLRNSEGREGWEDALLGCLKDHANLQNFPRLREILTRLLFAPAEEAIPSSSASNSSRASTPHKAGTILSVPSTPTELYHTIPVVDRIEILSFLCNLAISSKAMHSHMEYSEEQLTALRKEKIDVNRQKKQYIEEMSSLTEQIKKDPTAASASAGASTSISASAIESAALSAGLEPDGDISMRDFSDTDTATPSEAGSESASIGKKTARQKVLRQKIQTQAFSKQREAARAKQATAKQALSEHRRLDEEVNKLERRLEGIEREFRKLLGVVRVRAIGKDRFHNRVWWFDGLGSAALVGSGGVVQYGTGRLFLQGPSEFDTELLDQRIDEDIVGRRLEEEGEEGILQSGDWAVYSDLEELEEFVAWLNPKGHRELALKGVLTKWWPHITAGIKKRSVDLSASTKLPEARRSTRAKAHTGSDLLREPYMIWTNRRAMTNTA